MFFGNDTMHGNGTMPRLQVWVIVNPTSGHGRGKVLLHSIQKALWREFRDCVTRVHTASKIISGIDAEDSVMCNGDTLPGLPLNAARPSEFSNGQLDQADKNTDDESTRSNRGGGMQVDIIVTEHKTRGQEIAEYLTKIVVASRLRRCLDEAAAADASTLAGINNKKQSDLLHIFVAVGGDGSLNDVVNGLCRGTLEAFREIIPTCVKTDTTSTGELDSVRYYWQSLEDRSILRHFLPPLIYILAGTGTDFARLNLCCSDEKEFVNLLRGLWGPSTPSSSPASSENVVNGANRNTITTTNNKHNSHGSNSTRGRHSRKHGKNALASFGFDVYDVDVGRVSFPRSGQSYFFINECSCGLSCDVIEKCENYKRSKFLSLAGGRIMFAAASIISVFQVRPKPFRFFPLPEVASLPSNRLIPRCIASELLHPHILMNDAAIQGVQRDLQWVKTSAGVEALPEMEPLRFGANYYAYDAKMVRVTPDHAASANGGEVVINPFYSDQSCRDAKTPDEIVAAINDTDVPGRWICMQSSVLAFANGRWFGGGLQVAPHANPTDGQLSVTSWFAGFGKFVSHALSLYSGNHTHWPFTTIWNTTRTIIDVDTRSYHHSAANNSASRTELLMASCETDGEIRQRLPAVIEMCSVVTMLVPRGKATRIMCNKNYGKCVNGKAC
ncbi:sphingosine kinase A, B, putative [Trypanosoma cruzi marinkellei]|uniref:Sphingosine kinase A, B, putative n=1 Tax=Trypanosoma cruzi marinkellei TaxID=85056 RepID=K2N0A6_TRYCR|nr:sphingosine kinase A, B, putative [Trypanosoma cruzi marinkellei]